MHACAPLTGAPGTVPGAGLRGPGAGLPALEAVRHVPGPGLGEAGRPVTDSLVVVSWNVHVGGGDLPAFVADLESGALTGGGPPPAFVILLQEVHRREVPGEAPGALRSAPGEPVQPLHFAPASGDRADVVSVARALGLHLAYAPAVPNGRPAPGAPFEDRGVAILSTHPLDSIRVLELPMERQRRVAVAATLHGAGSDGAPWSLQVVSAHLENRTGWGRFLDSFGAARERQARSLAARLGTGPTVLGGDLNTWGPSFLETALPLLESHFPHTPDAEGGTFRLAGIPRRLDHLLFRLPERSSASTRVVAERYGSDHHPVTGVVALPTSR